MSGINKKLYDLDIVEEVVSVVINVVYIIMINYKSNEIMGNMDGEIVDYIVVVIEVLR